jgi:hypothetical protein
MAWRRRGVRIPLAPPKLQVPTLGKRNAVIGPGLMAGTFIYSADSLNADSSATLRAANSSSTPRRGRKEARLPPQSGSYLNQDKRIGGGSFQNLLVLKSVDTNQTKATDTRAWVDVRRIVRPSPNAYVGHFHPSPNPTAPCALPPIFQFAPSAVGPRPASFVFS